MIGRVYTEHKDRPLYHWKLNVDGSITKNVVTMYRESTYSKETHIFFLLNSAPHTVKGSQMNRFLNNRIASFENNDEKVFKLIEDALAAKASKHKYEYENAEALLEAMRSKNGK